MRKAAYRIAESVARADNGAAAKVWEQGVTDRKSEQKCARQRDKASLEQLLDPRDEALFFENST